MKLIAIAKDQRIRNENYLYINSIKYHIFQLLDYRCSQVKILI